MNQKNKHTLYLSDETWENIEKQIKADNFKSSSEFVEMAAIHYPIDLIRLKEIVLLSPHCSFMIAVGIM